MREQPVADLRLLVAAARDASGFDFLFTNHGDIAVCDVAIDVHEFWLDFAGLDDTHMPNDMDNPPMSLQRVDAGDTLRLRVDWALRHEPWSGVLAATWHTGEQDPIQYTTRVPFAFDPQVRRTPRA